MNDAVSGCIAPQTPALREAVGAFVLGALGPTESDLVSAHLTDCAACRVEYAELLDLLPLLASVCEQEAVHGPVRPEPAVLGRVLASARRPARENRRSARPGRRSPRTRIALAAACVVLAAGGAAAGVAVSTSGDAAPPAGWSANARSGYPGGDVTASVRVTATSSGSSLQLTMQHVKPGYRCKMVVLAADGHRETAGTWSAPASGTVVIPGSVSIPPNQIAAVQVDLPDGTTLVNLTEP